MQREKLAFETLYELTISLFTDFFPKILKIWNSFPNNVQQLALLIGLLFAFPILDKLIDGVFKLWDWWASRH